MTNLSIGQVVSGEVSGIRSYGAFVKLDNSNKQGLIHISECKNGYVKDISQFLSLGQKVTVIILNKDEYTGEISLSLRALQKVSYDVQHINAKKYWTNYKHKIGFTSIEHEKDRWITEIKAKITK
ncbi:CvfD/Ygs/GSP13 family RNA-binding post-transcriptional regulator [Bombilactobacillus thymidiniphilus]|uniref:CvfD/Ygs/GSP13 family RNA-binding post-transcriptional regulator n=1 Tax=Bombilactobacillus thymidiniphilus TaxID=2923363 RepID=A0ABY4PDQ7_9LACO|nr:CvfD/Ygs/GSP13 family RNA-binding post-transcriptional regulator [Bombilactobacillus thymidiniphilus]UQS83870.1 CvfD/Ygs/GSP13 family RNA-binding post-transcriptional regulator [Bombilactobacillus thymidiniphilus]